MNIFAAVVLAIVVNDAACQTSGAQDAIVTPPLPKCATEAETTTSLPEGFVFVHQFNPGVERVNLILNTNAEIPEQVWADPVFRESIGVGEDGQFAVRLWRIDDCGRVAELPAKVRVAARCCGQHSSIPLSVLYAQELQAGDMVFVGYTPGLLFQEVHENRSARRRRAAIRGPVVADETGHAVRLGSVPFLVVIDAASGDPVSVPGTRLRRNR